MELHLKADVYAAASGGRLVVLDVAGDRYLGLDPQVRLSEDGARLSVSDPSLADALVAAGVAERTPDPRRTPSRPWPRPARDLPLEDFGRLTATDLAQAAAAGRDAIVGYCGRPLERLVAAARRAPAADPGAEPEPGLVALAGGFRRTAPFLPMPAKCLLRAYLLRRALGRAGYGAAWVFGVRTWPFAAHCWLQAGDMVLDDHWERLAVYEPILVI